LIKEDLDKLKIKEKDLVPKYSSFQGTRHIIQYEGPGYIFTLSKTFKPEISCRGISNRCEDGSFIFFADYDKVYKSVMIKNLSNLLKRFPGELDTFYIAATAPEEILEDGKIKGSYHVVNFVKHRKSKIAEFLEYCDVDPFFIEIPEKTAHKCHVLRYSEKISMVNNKIIKERPEFIQVYPIWPSQTGKECSLPHFRLFEKIWGIPFSAGHKFDNATTLERHLYSTPKKPQDLAPGKKTYLEPHLKTKDFLGLSA